MGRERPSGTKSLKVSPSQKSSFNRSLKLDSVRIYREGAPKKTKVTVDLRNKDVLDMRGLSALENPVTVRHEGTLERAQKDETFLRGTPDSK